MERLEDALQKALKTNAEEVERWQKFIEENQTAIANLDMFGKSLTVDVMVPIGKKAFMSGNLIHTNEVLVGHYQGYFSKCSAFKAKELCQFRINSATEHLKNLETEAELWQNKLNRPYSEGVVPTGEEREIMEEYDEEKENLWKEQHKLKLKTAKLKEKEQREKEAKKPTMPTDKSDEEIFKMLEDAELMEELEQELEKLKVDEVNDETIRRLMSGEMKLVTESKSRTAHEQKTEDSNEKQTVPSKNAIANIVKKERLQENIPATNNNNEVNTEILQNLDYNDEEDTEEEDDTLEEVKIIQNQAIFLTPADQIGFYEYQIEIIQQKLKTMPFGNPQELNEKIRLLSVLESLEELLEAAEEVVGTEELMEEEQQNVDKDANGIDNNIIKHEKSLIEQKDNNLERKTSERRISFALEDQTLEFRKNEAVNQMLPKKKAIKPKRDIIRLDDAPAEDDNTQLLTKEIVSPAYVPDKKQIINAKVEQNLKFISENQSTQDFDLVNKILESSNGAVNTLSIKFKHSSQTYEPPSVVENKTIAGSPADFYNSYLELLNLNKKSESVIFVNSYEGEELVKVPTLKEYDKEHAYIDPRAEFSNPSLQTKSILRNKDSVNVENHQKSRKKKKAQVPKDDEYMSAYDKVMNDVTEKPLTEPEPLPDVKYIDAHAPKKRISRFKQSRQNVVKT